MRTSQHGIAPIIVSFIISPESRQFFIVREYEERPTNKVTDDKCACGGKLHLLFLFLLSISLSLSLSLSLCLSLSLSLCLSLALSGKNLPFQKPTDITSYVIVHISLSLSLSLSLALSRSLSLSPRPQAGDARVT